MLRATLLLLSVLTVAAFCGESPEDLKKAGMQALYESQTNPGAVVKAAEFFSKASDKFEAAGNDAEAQESNSYLYWCKKKMNMQQIEAFTHAAPFKPAPVVSDPAAEARAFFERAEAFAKFHSSDHLLVAIRYFEVADRFTSTEFGMKAQRLSLQEMQAATVLKPAPVPTVPPKTVVIKALPVVKGVSEETTKAMPTPAELSTLPGNKDQAALLLNRLLAGPETWTALDCDARWNASKEVMRISNCWFSIFRETDTLRPYKVNKSVSSGDVLTMLACFKYHYVVAAPTKEELLVRLQAHKPGTGLCGMLITDYTDRHPIDFINRATRLEFCDWLDAQKSCLDTALYREQLKQTRRFGDK